MPRCRHLNRVPVSVKGGVVGMSAGRCDKEAFPGLVVCFEHADKEALGVMVQTLLRDYELATGKKHRYETKRDG